MAQVCDRELAAIPDDLVKALEDRRLSNPVRKEQVRDWAGFQDFIETECSRATPAGKRISSFMRGLGIPAFR